MKRFVLVLFIYMIIFIGMVEASIKVVGKREQENYKITIVRVTDGIGEAIEYAAKLMGASSFNDQMIGYGRYKVVGNNNRVANVEYNEENDCFVITIEK
ncbi:MAG: hypothetical protein ACRCSK_01485 [Fusobacteriaceae bacterium]